VGYMRNILKGRFLPATRTFVFSISFVLGNVVKNGWWLIKIIVLYMRGQSEEETSSGGDQLVSNKIGAYTKKVRVGHLVVQPLLFLVSLWLQKLIYR
jgi:hypothetical protein